MSKILDATCQGKVVTSQDVQVPAAKILSEGIGESEGLLLLEGARATYITSSASDLKQTLNQVAEALQTIAGALEAIGSNMTGDTTSPPGSLPGDVASIQSAATALQALMENLK